MTVLCTCGHAGDAHRGLRRVRDCSFCDCPRLAPRPPVWQPTWKDRLILAGAAVVLTIVAVSIVGGLIIAMLQS